MSRVSLQDSINPKPQSEGIVEEHPRQLVPSVGILSAEGRSSAPVVTSAAFKLESPTPPERRDSVRCGSFEFVPHTEASRSISAEPRGNMGTTFGGVHFIVDSRGFLRLPSSNASSPGTSAPGNITSAAALAALSRSTRKGSRSSFDAVEEQRKKQRDSRREKEERVVARPRQYEQGCHSARLNKNRLRTPYLSATEQLEAPCYLHSYIDPKDCLEKSSHLLRDCREFIEIRQFCDDRRAEAMARVHTMERRVASYSYQPEPYGPNPYVPDPYVPDLYEPESKEKIEFEVVDWESQYHAILGRPAFAKFMAVPHYAYLKKMSGNNGTTLTIHGSFSRSDNCDRDFQKIASKFGAKEELNAVVAVIIHSHHPIIAAQGCDRLSFLDVYSGYNQIKLKKEDQELTAFITPHCVFCYNVMTFGLKNAGATYQRCMQACLGEQIGRNIEVYIDDIVVKTKHAATLIDDLRETFDNLDRYKIKLNPKKCFFGVPGGQVLGYFISARGIEANPLKIKAILDMEPSKNLHQVQQLAGRLAALSRFIAKLGEKALPFYNLMKKSEKFEWTDEAQESFDRCISRRYGTTTADACAAEASASVTWYYD
ncbi:hypothetical protein QYE76_023935 [Lolium multiflorum]|uniref:Reverse transcriptase domain-containing protein n=1 Tax=Lolium multiflorum TaxID=4521 RepID=A0AAD8RFS3_LOLMU|nr:hypothetical protein QYE76_023935 [Lolium multiflorum]